MFRKSGKKHRDARRFVRELTLEMGRGSRVRSWLFPSVRAFREKYKSNIFGANAIDEHYLLEKRYGSYRWRSVGKVAITGDRIVLGVHLNAFEDAVVPAARRLMMEQDYSFGECYCTSPNGGLRSLTSDEKTTF